MGRKEEKQRETDWQRQRGECASLIIYHLPVWQELVLPQLGGTASAPLVPPIYSAMLRGTETKRKEKLFIKQTTREQVSAVGEENRGAFAVDIHLTH